MTPQDIAMRAVTAMWESDTAAHWAGMKLGSIGPGRATVTMTIDKNHSNGHGTAHGGVIYMLAGTAFAMAINSYNVRTVAQAGAITYLAPVQIGDVLSAHAVEIALNGRNGVYDVHVTNQDGKTVAEFRGNSRSIGGTVFER